MRRRGAIVASLILLSVCALSFLPTTTADVAVVPGCDIQGFMVRFEIDHQVDHTIIDIYVNYTLTSYTEDLFTDTINITNGEIESYNIYRPADLMPEMDDMLELSLSTYNLSTKSIDMFYAYRINTTADGLVYNLTGNSSSFYELWVHYFQMFHGRNVIINSNVDVTSDLFPANTTKKYFEGSYGPRHYHSGGYGDYPEYYYNAYHHIFDLDIRWGNGSTCNISEHMFSDIREEHVEAIPELIEREFIHMSIADDDGDLSYTLDCMFEINETTISTIGTPTALWFPENGTTAYGNMTYIRTDYDYLTENYTYHLRQYDLEFEKGDRFGQAGFYIHIPDRHQYYWGLIDDFVINVSIEGTLPNLWWDFVLVTVPQEFSVIEVEYPATLGLKSHYTPFSNLTINEYTKNTSYITHGECSALETIHLKWTRLVDTDGDGVPDENDLEPDDPEIWMDPGVQADTLEGDPLPNDLDNDGVKDDEDMFPLDPYEWYDGDGDGLGDNKEDPSLFDRDNDNYTDTVDLYPDDPTEWSDNDNDGIPDNQDPYPDDRDNDGCLDAYDLWPDDPTEWQDADHDGLADNHEDPYPNDHDNDGYPDDVDDLIYDPTDHEDKDLDKLGDNTKDPYPNDSDNDGYNNTIDKFPWDPTEWRDEDGDGLGDDEDDPSLNDRDNDNRKDDVDAFPDDPKEWYDSDGDGIGDNSDPHPFDADDDGHPDDEDDYPDDPSRFASPATSPLLYIVPGLLMIIALLSLGVAMVLKLSQND